MNWYLAKLVFQITCGDGSHTPQFDEQLRLVQAIDREQAIDRARILGEEGEDRFYNARNQLVTWQFINLSELNSISNLDHGAELYSRIEEKDDAAVYIHNVHRRADDLRAVHEQPFLKLA